MCDDDGMTTDDAKGVNDEMNKDVTEELTECEVPLCFHDATEFHDLAGEAGVNLCGEHDTELFDFGLCSVAALVLPRIDCDPVEDTIWDRDIVSISFIPIGDDDPFKDATEAKIRWVATSVLHGEYAGDVEEGDDDETDGL